MKADAKYAAVCKLAGSVLLIAALIAVDYTCSFARQITDMAGRTITVPEKITRVSTDWAPVMYLMYAVDPRLLAAVNNPFSGKQREYLHPHVRKLPVVGGYFGQSATTDMESVLQVKPDVVIAEIFGDMALNAKSEQALAEVGIPTLYVKIDTTGDYPDAFDFLGKLLGREKRTRMLSAYGRSALKEVSDVVGKIPRSQRPRVYYAEGVTGLSTECHTSYHAELIGLAGATNVHQCARGLFKTKGKEAISLEQVLRYDPDVIIAAEPLFYQQVFTDRRWRNIKAVRTKQVFCPPRLLFNWFDRPPSFMRFLGLKWLAHCLYPATYRIDIVQEARSFYRLFLGIDIPADTMRRALHQ
jgi:iron complex transport system substrate-binding protein